MPWPKPGKHGQEVADAFNAEVKQSVEELVASGQGRPKLVGFLANEDPAGDVYARMTRRACERNGLDFELRKLSRLELEKSVIAANEDPSVHGMLVYYPVFGGGKDMYLRDVVSYTKDVEGLCHRYCYALYHNIRTLDATLGASAEPKKCVLPCTPLACVKVLENLGAYDLKAPVGEQLQGRTCMIYNRSEVVGRPLAAMLANDGAVVYSVDEHGMLVYTKGAVAGTIKVEETSISQADALKLAEIVISGVPVKSFVIPKAGMKKGAIAINVSQHMNFEAGVEETCALVPAIGRVTISILARNLIRLHGNFHTPAARASKAHHATAKFTPRSMLLAAAAGAAVTFAALKGFRRS